MLRLDLSPPHASSTLIFSLPPSGPRILPKSGCSIELFPGKAWIRPWYPALPRTSQMNPMHPELILRSRTLPSTPTYLICLRWHGRGINQNTGSGKSPHQCCSAPGAYRDRLWRLWRLSEALAPIGAYRRLTIAPIDSGAYPAPIVGAYRRLAPIKYFHRHFLCIHRMSAQQPAQRKATVRGAYQAPIDR